MNTLDYNVRRGEDALLSGIRIENTAIGGWNIQLSLFTHFGGSGLLQKVTASGFNGVSGVTITSSGLGTYTARMNSVESSGLAYGAYPYVVERLTSGSRTVLQQGYIVVQPGGV